MPEEIDERDTLLIAVLGINRAGKTYLLAAGLKQALRDGALEAAGVTEFEATEESAIRFHQNLFRPVFRHGHVLDPTGQRKDGGAVEPMVFRVEVDGRRFLLGIHDLAGEDIADPKTRARVAPFVRRADGILFVVDPVEIDAVRNNLPAALVIPDWRDWEQADVLAAVVNELEARAKTPVSVVLTKSDLIDLAMGRTFTFSQPSSPDSSAWEQDQQAVDREVRSLLKEWGFQQFEKSASRAGPAFFHAVSATGPTTVEVQMPGSLAPVRCADPIGTLLNLIVEGRRSLL